MAAVVVDYRRLEPRGYRVFSLSGKPVDRDEARQLAVDFIVNERGAPEPEMIDVDQSGAFFSCFILYPNGNEWLVVIHADSGQVLFAEPQLWGDEKLRGYDFPLPEEFNGPEALGCTDSAIKPRKVEGISTGKPYSGEESTAEEAWNVARRLNLTDELGGSSYRVMVISYAPAIGEFDAEAADWYVWIARD